MKILTGVMCVAFAVGCTQSDRQSESVAVDGATSFCEPGETRCSPEDPQQVVECTEDGSQFQQAQMCEGAEQCVAGHCIDACAEAAESRSYMGCEYWPTTLGNARMAVFGGEHPMTIALSNPHPYPVSASVTGGALTEPLETVVEPYQIQTIDLPQIADLAMTIGSHLEASGAYRLVTTAPVAAYQFALASGQLPDGSAGSTVNDASLLLPTPTLGTEHMILSYDDAHWGESIMYGGMFSIVATSDQPTTVSVIPTSNITAGTGVAAMSAGGTHQVVLQRGDVLQLAGDGSGDLTGSIVTSDQPVAVFTGHIGAQVPRQDDNLVDHLQEQLPHSDSWGTQFVMAPLADIPTRVRILAVQGDTALSFDPPSVAEATVLASGSYYELEMSSDTPFTITASERVLVGQYMESPGGSGQAHDSYPSLVLATPVEQYRDAVVLYTPSTHPDSVLQIAGSAQAAPSVDGASVSSDPIVVGTSGRAIWNVTVPPGSHRVSASSPVSVITFGLEGITTYAYPGGLDLANTVD